MASGRRGRREDGGVDPDTATGPRLESPHFFKIILSDTLESGKLGIPKKFLRRYGKDLSSLVLLEVLGNSTWSMGVEKLNDGTVWLWKGWREFMQHYSIGPGHLVVFKYKGNSTFRVMIFDRSASEIDYSLSSISNLGSGFISPKRENVIEVEDSEDFAPCQKKRVDPHSSCSQPSPSCSSPDLEECSLLVHQAAHSANQGNRDSQAFKQNMAGRNKESKCRMNRSEPVFCDPTPSRPLTTPELAGEFDSEHPFFELVIQQSHFRKMHVPGQFVRQHIQENKKEGTLRYSDRSWPVKLSRYTRGIRVFFSAGWRAFARETHLCEGNVCVFELIDRDDVVFKVSIFSSGGKDQIHID
ncbi:B3 domain-containing transcription factor VRN1 isoform X4 [Eucalyptus grandis]|uniref:B3 domain-containing transcription factor VRN1 isoform X4 n=1 Tax=Eucalyptus grandis TaxID=71139 RepID=UPI00192EAC1C|nr:B3 domain-containing transcription factor VRN1 isoform X4 [Eucalyptus grandis]